MSGGHFNYSQYHISTIKETIESLIYRAKSGEKDEYGIVYKLSDQTIEEFERALVWLELAYIYTQRIDWFISGDDGEETFHERLQEEVGNALNSNLFKNAIKKL